MDANASQGPGTAPAQPAGDLATGFRKFDSYPWTRDRSFLQGLMATLGPTAVSDTNGFSRQKALSTTLQARIWWYKSRFNLDIDRAAYEAYSAGRPQSSGPDATILAKLEEIQQRMGGGNGGSTSSGTGNQGNSNIPEWQRNAPKVDLSKKADDGAGHASTGDGAPYPDNFQALIEAVTQGKPIPGIKEIPDTVVRPPGVTPFGKMKAPRKPWEKDQESGPAAQASVFGNVVDNEFPPLPGGGGGGGGGSSQSPAQ